MSCEIVKENLNYDKNNPIHFLKWNYINTDKLNQFKDNLKPSKIYSIPLNGSTKSGINIKKLSGIIDGNNEDIKNNLQSAVNSLIPYSFILYTTLKLKSPYFSSDDDNFYLIQNPCLKEKVFKVPMIRGSGWKGAIAKAGKDLINEDLKQFDSYIRIFGTGSNEFRDLIDTLGKNKNLSDKLINYSLFELGIRLNKDKIEKIKNKPKEFLEDLHTEFKSENIKNIHFLQTHKGRTIFYPTYFNKLSLEIINPHNRKTRAGTNPIHYEVVPEGTEGILQIVYIPFDGALEKSDELKKEIEKDIDFLTKAIEKTANIGIGAKEKLGWGRFEIKSLQTIKKEV